MSEIKWIKLSTSMFENEKIKLIEQLPEADTLLIIWVKLLSQAGKTNAGGYIYLNENIPYTDEMLSTIFNRPVSTVRLALKTFQQFGMIYVDNDNFISIENWEKHQNVEGMDRIRKQTRERVKRHREKKKIEDNNNVTLPVTQSNGTEVEVDKEVELEVDKEITTATTNDDAIQFYQNNFGTVTPYEQEAIVKYIKSFGQTMVLEALKRTIKRGKKNWGYAETILKSWKMKNITTIDQANAEQHNFNMSKGKTTKQNTKGKGNEIVPEWFNERKQNKQDKGNSNKHYEESEEEKAEFQALLNEFIK